MVIIPGMRKIQENPAIIPPRSALTFQHPMALIVHYQIRNSGDKANMHNFSFRRPAAFKSIFRFLLPVALICLTAPAAAQISPQRAAWQPEEWYQTDEARQVADNVLTWQNEDGGWPKNYTPSQPRPEGPRRGQLSTFDNGATYSELRLLARAHRAQQKPEYRQAFERALEYILEAQFDNGGWPQIYPLRDNYSRHITYNDGAMVGIMRLLESIINEQPEFAFLSDEYRSRARDAFNRGIECILNTQVRVELDNQLTGWGQQHDAETLAPTAARAFEPPALTSNESAGIAMLLMTQPDPDEPMRDAIHGVMRWFESTRITGQRYMHVDGPQYENGRDRIVLSDPSSEQRIWARLYDIERNQPIFAGRDSIVRYALHEVEHERRTGYAWYGTWPARALAMYEEWKQEWGEPDAELTRQTD
jgi:PelA/Pel-15E family pectate lyase